MNRVHSAKIDKMRTSIDRFAAQADNPSGNEFLRQHIKELSLPMRVAKTALLALHTANPEMFSRYSRRPYEKAGYSVIGIGVHSIALADGESVLKVYRSTIGLSEDAQSEMKAYWEKKQNVLLDNLEEYAVPQSFSIDTHPADETRSVVVARQPYIVNGRAVNLYDEVPRAALHPFIEDSLSMYDNANALPDIVGTNNIIETNSGLKIVDTIPLEASDPTDAAALEKAKSILGIDDHDIAA
jgi:hypothetical protein